MLNKKKTMRFAEIEEVKKLGPQLSQKDKLCRRIIDYGILSLIIFTPLPAASVYDWSIFIIQITVFLMMIFYFLMDVKPKTNKYLLLSLRWPKYLSIGFFIFILMQIVPIPTFIVKILSPNTYSFQKFFLTDFVEPKFISLSVVPSHSLKEGLEFLAYFLLGFLIIKTVTTKRQIMRILSVLVGMGIFESLYGLFELYNKNPRILFYKKVYSLDSVTGTFVNRNHFSGYLEIIIPLTIGLIITKIDIFSQGGMKLKRILLRLAEKGLAINLLLTCGLIGMSLGIVFSKSRSGSFVLMFSFFLIFALTILYYKGLDQQQRWIKLFLKIVFLIITFISLYIGIGATIERFDMDQLLQAGRFTVWSNSIEAFNEFFLVGTGLGTYSSIFPAYDEAGRLMHFTHAHNDFLEYLSELGILGFILIMGLVFFILIKVFAVWKKRASPDVKGIALGGFVACISILIHSITDFNLHIPANTLLFSVVLSLTLVTVFYQKRDRK